MKKLNSLQILGIGLVILGFSVPFFTENDFLGTLSGITAAIGVALILKWFPYTKKKN